MIYVPKFLFVLSFYVAFIAFGASFMGFLNFSDDYTEEGRKGIYLKRMTISLAYIAFWFLVLVPY